MYGSSKEGRTTGRYARCRKYTWGLLEEIFKYWLDELFMSLFSELLIVEYHFEGGCCDIWSCLLSIHPILVWKQHLNCSFYLHCSQAWSDCGFLNLSSWFRDGNMRAGPKLD